jgi:hypothetical protein
VVLQLAGNISEIGQAEDLMSADTVVANHPDWLMAESILAR